MPSTSVYSGHKFLAKPLGRATESSIHSVDCVKQLDTRTEATWQSFRAANPLLENGSFHPEFSRAVCRVRKGVEFAVIQGDDGVSAILPFQRIGGNIGHPVGGMMNDFQGPITDPSTTIDYQALLRLTRLKRLDFHALASDSATESSKSIKRVYQVLDCPHIDLGEGSFAYREWLLNHSSTIRRQRQKVRAMVRHLGPLRLEFDCRDPKALELLIEWKRAKFRRTRTFDLLSVDWTSNLLREIFQVRVKDFRGLLTGLYAGDTLVSAHFGFVGGNSLHYWFPAHNPEFRRYSPGTQLMIELTGAAVDNDVHRIDLGYGESDLKDRFANGKTTVEYGCFGTSAMMRMMCQRRYEIRQALKRVPAKEMLKKIVRPMHPNLGKGKFR